MRKLTWFLAFIILFLTIITLAFLAPIKDNSQLIAYAELQFPDSWESSKGDPIKVGWSAINITPTVPISLAGYGPRGPYLSVSDSLYARILLFDNGLKEVVIVSLDLLMFPRHIRERVEAELSLLGFDKDEIYLAATHTHHGFGNWEKSLGGQFAFGAFSEGHSDELVKQIITGINKAQSKKSLSQIGFKKIYAGELVINRLAPGKGSIDPFIRILEIENVVGETAVMGTFSGHATNLDADVWKLSRDYPGVLVDNLEQASEIDFAMFCAGMVGSHNIDIDINKGKERIDAVGKQLANKILKNISEVHLDSLHEMKTVDLKIDLPPSQMRVLKHFHLRDWVFRLLLGPLEANIKALKIGDNLLVGMPCDYSGELSINNQLDILAEEQNLNLLITSFNGNYVGYITEDSYYSTHTHDEVRVMNWMGPNMGQYFTDVIKKIIKTAN